MKNSSLKINIIAAVISVIVVGVVLYVLSHRQKKVAPPPRPKRIVKKEVENKPTPVPTRKPADSWGSVNTGRVEQTDPTPEDIAQMKARLLDRLPKMIEAAKKSIEMEKDPTKKEIMQAKLNTVQATLENVKKVDPKRRSTWKYLSMPSGR